MTSPLAKLRTFNRPTNGQAWVREAERLLAEAYERPVDAATCGDAPVLPPGATEFESDGMRALLFTDTDGDLCEVRASARQEYQVKFHGQAGGWATLDSGCMSDGDPDSPAFPWLRSVWAEMREKERQPVSLKAARESALQALSDAEERLAEERESDEHPREWGVTDRYPQPIESVEINISYPSEERESVVDFDEHHEPLVADRTVSARLRLPEEPDALVEILERVSRNYSESPRHDADEALALLKSERAQHAEEVARLKSELSDFKQGQIALDLLRREPPQGTHGPLRLNPCTTPSPGFVKKSSPTATNSSVSLAADE